MKKNVKIGLKFLASIAACICLIIISGCGQKESQGGLFGGAAGAIIGGAAGDEEGALLGAAAGAMLGSAVGRQADKEDEDREHQREVERLTDEKRELTRQLDKWCEDCNRKVRIRGAQSCPRCGGKLIHEQICDRCRTTYNPRRGYRFCPKCSVRTRLRSR